MILWIASETESEVAKCFSEAAAKLQLEGYSETTGMSAPSPAPSVDSSDIGTPVARKPMASSV